MSGVATPNNRKGTKESLSGVGTIVGGVVGGYFGGPSGAVEGAAAGGEAGSKIGGILGGNAQTPRSVETKTGDAISRRLDVDDPSQDLAKADAALQQLPDDYQEQYGPMIRRARMLDQQQKGTT